MNEFSYKAGLCYELSKIAFNIHNILNLAVFYP